MTMRKHLLFPCTCLVFEMFSLYHKNSQSWRLPNSISSLGHTGNPASRDTGSSAVVKVGGFLCTEYLTSPTCSTAPSCHASEFSAVSGTSSPPKYSLTTASSGASTVSCPRLFLDFLDFPWLLRMPLEIRAKTLLNGSPWSRSMFLWLPCREKEMVSLGSPGRHLTTAGSILPRRRQAPVKVLDEEESRWRGNNERAAERWLNMKPSTAEGQRA